MTRYTAREKAECAEREVKQRRRVYGRLVQQNKMSETAARVQIEIMEEIAADYRDQAEAEEAQGRLL